MVCIEKVVRPVSVDWMDRLLAVVLYNLCCFRSEDLEVLWLVCLEKVVYLLDLAAKWRRGGL